MTGHARRAESPTPTVATRICPLNGELSCLCGFYFVFFFKSWVGLGNKAGAVDMQFAPSISTSLTLFPFSLQFHFPPLLLTFCLFLFVCLVSLYFSRVSLLLASPLLFSPLLSNTLPHPVSPLTSTPSHRATIRKPPPCPMSSPLVRPGCIIRPLSYPQGWALSNVCISSRVFRLPRFFVSSVSCFPVPNLFIQLSAFLQATFVVYIPFHRAFTISNTKSSCPRVESPSASNEAVVERLGRIEALLEEQSHRLQNLFLHEPSSSSFDGSHLSISPKVSIDASAAGVVDSSEGTDPSLFGSHSHPFSRSPFHLTPEFAASAIAGLGGITAPGAPTTSPPAPVHVPSPVGGNSLLGIDASNRPQYLYQQQPHRSQQQHFFNAFHGTSSSSNTAGSTAAPTPVFGYPTGTSAFPSGSGLTSTTTTTSNTINTATIGNTNTSRGLLSSGKAPSSVATSEVSSTQQNVEQDQQFLIPYEHSTSANTLLSHPLVRFFLEYQQRAKSNVLERRPSGGSGAGKGKGKAQFTTYHYHYPRTYFFDIENQHPLPPQLDLVFSPGVVPAILTQPVLAASHPTVLDGLVRNYFTYVHPSAPLFSASRFRQWSSKVYEQGPDDSIGTAICLVVWALGSLVAPSTQGGAPSRSSSCSSSPDPTVQRQSQNERDRFALSLFQPAMKIILRHTLWEFGPAALETSQALRTFPILDGHCTMPDSYI